MIRCMMVGLGYRRFEGVDGKGRRWAKLRSTGAVWFEIPCTLSWLGYAESTVEGCVRCTSEFFDGHRLHIKEVMPIRDKIA